MEDKHAEHTSFLFRQTAPGVPPSVACLGQVQRCTSCACWPLCLAVLRHLPTRARALLPQIGGGPPEAGFAAHANPQAGEL